MVKQKLQDYEDAIVHAFIEEHAILRFLSAGDAHGDFVRVQKYIAECMKEKQSLNVVFTGDYQAEPEKDRSRARENVKRIFKMVKERLEDKLIFVLGGNYEAPAITAEAASELGKPLFSIGSLIETSSEESCSGNYFKHDKFTFIGVEGTNPINGFFPGERTEQELQLALEKAVEKECPTDIMILLTHAPPYRCGSRDALGVFGLPSSYWGRHVGSTAIMSFLQKHKPILHVCGHVHEGVSVSACLWREDGNVGIEDF